VYASADADVVGAGTATTNGESEFTSPQMSPFSISVGSTSTGWPFTKWIRSGFETPVGTGRQTVIGGV
jgi:hypothetical protein